MNISVLGAAVRAPEALWVTSCEDKGAHSHSHMHAVNASDKKKSPLCASAPFTSSLLLLVRRQLEVKHF